MRRFFAPEVVQTSALDCGPAALQSFLAGFKIPSNYGRLREACQTGLDGTSIDTIELVANARGLEAEQVLLPPDHVFQPQSNALPAIAVVTLADGLSHFVVVWRRHGRYLQVMDPAVGRRWVKSEAFARELYRHQLNVPAEGWREFAGSDEFCRTLARRLSECGVKNRHTKEVIRSAKQERGWFQMAALDAACRALSAIHRAKPLGHGDQAYRILQSLLRKPESIPAQFWSVRAIDEETVNMRGAVLVRALGKRAEPVEDSGTEEIAGNGSTPSSFGPVLRFLRIHGFVTPGYLAIATAGVSAGLLVEALLFRGLFDFASQLHLPAQRIGAVAALALFSAIVLLLDMLTFTGTTRICRRLETTFRKAFLFKIPRLPDRYFQSRLQSDMGERSHALHRLRYLPDVFRRLIASVLELLATATGMVWLEPATAPFVALAVAAALIPAFLSRAFLNESDLRVRTHAAALTRFYLDAALGLSCIRVHGAENNLRRAHGARLKEWIRAALRLQRAVVAIEGVQTTAMFSAIAMLFLTHPMQGANVGRLLLVAYWALNLPTAGQNIGVLARQLPWYRSLILRVCEPLGTAEQSEGGTTPDWTTGPAICFTDVSAEASGHKILDKIDLDIPAGSHVAIVGPSGAGKSSLIGLLLGWLATKSGQLLLNGLPLNAADVRRRAAWVDPAIQLWNQSLYDNLMFGSSGSAQAAGEAVDAAHLRTVLQDLPSGLQTVLGEGGGRLSGGEGQRVRLARAILRTDARLVLLDEPFRGLDRELRQQLLTEVRHRWAQSTLLCVTHDLAETRSFDRVLVIEDGRVVEQGTPADLLASEFSRYRALVKAEEELRVGLWNPRYWRRIKIHSGRLSEENPQRPMLQTVGSAEEVA